MNDRPRYSPISKPEEILSMTVSEELTLAQWLCEEGQAPGQIIGHLCAGTKEWDLQNLFLEPSLGGIWCLIAEYANASGEFRYKRFELNVDISDIIFGTGSLHFKVTAGEAVLLHSSSLDSFFPNMLQSVHDWGKQYDVPPQLGVSDAHFLQWAEKVLNDNVVTRPFPEFFAPVSHYFVG